MHRDPSFTDPLAMRYHEACLATDGLFAIVKSGHLLDRPIAERHRTVFYIGHLEAFDWNLLGKDLVSSVSFDPAFDRLFAFGIDPVGGGLPDDQASAWPAMEAISAYQSKIRESVRERLSAVNLTNGSAQLATLLNVAIEHRLMHAETLAYMLHRLPLAHKNRRAGRAAVVAAGPPSRVAREVRACSGGDSGRPGNARL